MAEPQKVFYKTVLMPISVPYGDFCFGEGRICEHFDSTGGYYTCDFNFYPLERDRDGNVLKPKECRDLKEAK
jgi:hypothetical protein